MSRDGDLVISAGGQSLGGWTDIEIIRGIEICPWVFNIGYTEKFAASSAMVQMRPGDPCVVTIGGDVVLTGYIDRLRIGIQKTGHSLSIAGRSKSQDAVDCSAEWPGGQIKGSSVLEIARKLVEGPYKITVNGEVDTGPPIPQFNLTIGESAYGIIERLARSRGLLIYDTPEGNLALARAGSDKMASGFVQGKNIEAANAEYAMDERFSDYEGFITAVDTLQNMGGGGNLKAAMKDPGVKRHRLRTIIAEDGALGIDQLKPRIQWEAARRLGRSASVSITTDSWRDSSSKLWAPNCLAPIDAAALKLPAGTDWLITQAVLRRSLKTGTTADLVLMPKEAFLPEPIILLPAGIPGELARAPG